MTWNGAEYTYINEWKNNWESSWISGQRKSEIIGLTFKILTIFLTKGKPYSFFPRYHPLLKKKDMMASGPPLFHILFFIFYFYYYPFSITFPIYNLFFFPARRNPCSRRTINALLSLTQEKKKKKKGIRFVKPQNGQKLLSIQIPYVLFWMFLFSHTANIFTFFYSLYYTIYK